MSGAELTEIARRICEHSWMNMSKSIKLLRSIEIAALRSAVNYLEQSQTDTPVSDLNVMIGELEKKP